MRFAAVLSDLDGVLVDSAAATSRAWARWGERRGVDGAAIQAANHGRPARDILAEYVSLAELDDEAAFLQNAEVTDTDGVFAFPGAAEVLALPVVAIVTSCTLPLAHARLAAAGLPVPDVLVSSDQIDRGKPAPDAYLRAAERLGTDPAGCLVLEDAPSGIAAGRAAGMTVWAVETTHAPEELGGAQRIAPGLPPLLRELSRRAA
jgi:mannitol-1-/sugar-/sorbitol-6-phosphatase